MSLHAKLTIITALSFAIPAAAQFGFIPLKSASGEEFETSKPTWAPAEGRSKGSVSVMELEQPLRGESKKLIQAAQQWLQQGKRDKLFAVLEKGVKDRAAAPYAYSMLGAEHLKDGNLRDALPALETAVALFPGLAENHHNLAIALSHLNRDREALSEVRMALQLDPGRPSHRYVAGVVLLRLGRKEEAEFHLRKAASQIPAANLLLSQIHGQ